LSWTFIASFASAVAGGAIGAVAILLVYRGERKARQAEVFTSALAGFMRAMSEHAANLRVTAANVRGVILPPTDNSMIVSALNVACLVANNNEYAVLRSLSGPIAFAEIGQRTKWDQPAHYEAWVAELMLWRRGTISSRKCIADFEESERDMLGQAKRNGATEASE
jgi:hypothetical protein